MWLGLRRLVSIAGLSICGFWLGAPLAGASVSSSAPAFGRSVPSVAALPFSPKWSYASLGASLSEESPEPVPEPSLVVPVTWDQRLDEAPGIGLILTVGAFSVGALMGKAIAK